MRRIIEKVEKAKSALPKGNLFKWLSDESIDGLTRLSFAPSMLYYLMGFKDVLDALYRRDSDQPLDGVINAYCGEDAEHWRWYLEDLEKLGFDLHTWGNSIPEWCNEVWSPATAINRKTIFELVNHANANRNPLYALSLILVFEATGVVFIGHTRRAAIALGMDNELKYFGRVHYEEEFGHSAQARDFENMSMDDVLHSKTEAMVDKLFAAYDRLFECWYEHRNHYSACMKGRMAQ